MLTLILLGCTQVPAPENAEVTARIDAGVAMRTGALVGVSVDPDDGARYVLGAMDGLFRVDDGSLTLVATPSQLTDPDFGDLRPYTDVAALGGGRFAVTVARDGLLFDSAIGTTKRHFCYEPGGEEWIEERQITDSLAFDPATNLILANPQTLRGDEVIASDIATFDAATGVPQLFDPLDDPEFRAGGLAPDGDDQVLLASGPIVSRQIRGNPGREPLVDLSSFVTSIDGLVLDASTGNVIIADSASGEILEISGWR